MILVKLKVLKTKYLQYTVTAIVNKLRSEDQETEQIFIGLLIEMVLCALQSSRLTKALNHCNFILILGGRL